MSDELLYFRSSDRPKTGLQINQRLCDWSVVYVATTMASQEDEESYLDVSQQNLFTGLDLVGTDALHAVNVMASPWDPLGSNDWDREKPTEQCFLRIKR